MVPVDNLYMYVQVNNIVFAVDWLVQLGEHWTTVQEVAGSNPSWTSTGSLNK